MKNCDLTIDRLMNLLRQVPLDPSVGEFGSEARLMATIREENRNSPSMLAWMLMPYMLAGILLLMGLYYQMLSSNELKASASSYMADTSGFHDDIINP